MIVSDRLTENDSQKCCSPLHYSFTLTFTSSLCRCDLLHMTRWQAAVGSTH